MFTAQCKPSSYKPQEGDYAIAFTGEIAIVIDKYDQRKRQIFTGEHRLVTYCSGVCYRCFVGDCSITTDSQHIGVNDSKSSSTRSTGSFTPIKYISKVDIIEHFNMNVIYNYRTYTQAFYDIFTLDGDTITLRDKQQNLIVEENTFIVKQNANILDQNLLLLKQNSLLMEQNGLLLQLLAEKKVPEQADLLQL